ncbi:efflux RND transporter periplasmic adaptor subunit [Bryobacter aggregatus]|uniref:efflux RND transporter periplasmic adaptor subunit n=1 Tax=Bryobacter aggregatus TaxID=360054 RepID=UPI0009B5A33F|nr:efflux RND transporter periplasmic adaptor subunit [Bryobacter aggregatus]
MSEIKPKIRIGMTESSIRRKRILMAVVVIACAGGAYAAYNYNQKASVVEVPVAKVRRGEFRIVVRTRGEIRSVNSTTILAPQVPELRIVTLAESGKMIRKGEVVVEFDAAQQEQNLLERNTSVRTIDSQTVQTQASHRIVTELDGMNKMTAEYNLERSKLEASKAEVVSEIEGAKSRIDVGISHGELGQVGQTINTHKATQRADMERMEQNKDKAVRDVNRAKGYLSNMVLRAPSDGIVNLLPNFRTQGNWGSSPPPFKEGDRAWTGAAIAEIPDLSELRIDLKLEEVDRGKMELGQKVKVRVDAIPDREFDAKLDWISPIASVQWRGGGMTEKSFPARATIIGNDKRLRPGMSASAEILIESNANQLLIPTRASFSSQGKPSVYVQNGQNFTVRLIEVGKRNDNEIVVLNGLKEGEAVTLENPAEAARKQKKL